MEFAKQLDETIKKMIGTLVVENQSLGLQLQNALKENDVLKQVNKELSSAGNSDAA